MPPKARLVEMGSRASDGQIVDPAFLMRIYNQATARDREFFALPTEESIKWSVREIGTSWFAVENEKGEAVGAIAATLKPVKKGLRLSAIPWKAALPPQFGLLEKGFIVAGFRSKGYHATLLREIEKIAREKGVPKLYTVVRRDNIEAIKGLKEEGFKHSRVRSFRYAPLNLLKSGLSPKRFKEWFGVHSKRLAGRRRK